MRQTNKVKEALTEVPGATFENCYKCPCAKRRVTAKNVYTAESR